MKKMICFLLAMLLVTTTAFAAEADVILSALEKNQQLSSAGFTMDITTKLNQPLKFLSSIPMDDSVDIDIPLLLESLADATLHMDGSFLMSNDKRKADIAVTSAFDVPIVFNKNFRLDAWAELGNWVQYDYTNPDAPLYRTIAEVPFSTQYQVVDLTNAEQIAGILNAEKLSAFSKESLKLLKETALFGQKNGLYRVSFTDESFRRYLLQILPLYQELMAETIPEADAMFSGLATVLEQCSVLGSNGMTIEIKITPNGLISVENTEIHVALNLYDMLTAFEKTTNGLERDDAWIDFTLSIQAKINNHNKVTAIAIPEINEENAYYPAASSMSYYLRETPVFTEETIYYPMDKIATYYGFSVEKQDALAAIATPDKEHVVAFLPDTTTLFVDEAQIPTEVVPAMVKEGKLYCSQEVFDLLGIDISVFADGSGENSIQIRSHYYDYSFEEEVVPEEESEYTPRWLYYTIYHNQMPPVIDGKCYMPIYEFLLELTPGDFSFGDGFLQFAATEDNPLNIREVSAWVGDPHIYWNGEGLPLGGSVVEQNGIMYIPVEFAEQLHLSSFATIRFDLGYPQAYYHMELENPDYVEKFNSPTLFYNVHSDQTMYADHGQLFMPAYDFFDTLFAGNFTFEGDLMTYTATEENSFAIQSISVRPGDDFVTVNGEAITLNSPAVTINGVLRIPLSFAEELGLEIGTTYMSDYGTSFSFTKKNSTHEEKPNLLWYEFF